MTPQRKKEEMRSLIARASCILAKSLDYEETLSKVARLIVPDYADWCTVDLLDKNEALKKVVIMHSDPTKIELAYELQRRYSVPADAPRGIYHVIKTGVPEFYHYITDELLHQNAQDREHFRILKELGIRSAIIMPLLARDKVLGAITFISSNEQHLYTEEDMDFLEELARVCAQAVDNARLYSEAQHEVEARKGIETALRESEERYRNIFNQVPSGIVRSAMDRVLIDGNPAFCRMLGYERDELIGQSMIDLTHPDDRIPTNDAIDKLISCQKGNASLEKRYRHKNGHHVWANTTFSLVRDEAGSPGYLLAVIQDITERLKAEESLVIAKQNLEQKVIERTAELQQLTELLRRLATQLTSAEQRERQRLAELLHDHVQQLMIAAKIQLEMTAKVQTIEAIQERIQKSREYIAEALEAVRSLSAELRPPILYESGLGPALKLLAETLQQQHNLHVNVDIDADVDPGSVEMKVFIYQSVRELLLNIIKHAGTHECWLRVYRQENMAKIVVVDSGHGFNVDVINTGKQGFGLFSIRERIKALNGDLTIHSSPGQGTITEISIPVDEPVEEVFAEENERLIKTLTEPKLLPVENTKPQIKVLLVDDHKIVRQGVATILKSHSMDVIEAADGAEAVQKAIEHHPDVVIMDLNMPKMNGIEATQRIHKYSPEIHIIGLSVRGDSAVMETMRKAGAEALFNKADDIVRVVEFIFACVAKPSGLPSQS